MKQKLRALVIAAAALNLFAGPVYAESSILLSLVNSQKSLVTVKAETAVVVEQGQRPFIHQETGAILVQRKLHPIVHTRHGTGVFVDASGHIVTNSHNILKATRVTVSLYNGNAYPAEIVKVLPELDLALIKISTSEPIQPVTFSTIPLRLDERVYTIGGSALLKNTISEGKIKALGVQKSEENNVELLQVNFDIYQGDSGSPLFDGEGNFLGLMSAAAIHAGKVAYAIPGYKIMQSFAPFLVQPDIDQN